MATNLQWTTYSHIIGDMVQGCGVIAMIVITSFPGP